MVSGYVLHRYTSGRSYACERLIEGAQKNGVRLERVGASDVIVSQGGVLWHGMRLPSRDFVINRHKPRSEAPLSPTRQVNAVCWRQYNEYQCLVRFSDKASQLGVIRLGAFGVPEWVVTSSEAFWRDVMASVEEHGIGVPFIVKAVHGSQGHQVWLIHDEDEWSQVKRNTKEDVIIQRFVSESVGRDYRVVALRGRIIGVMERKAVDGEFRSNFSLGGSVIGITPDADMRLAIADAYRETGLDIIGLDLLAGRNGYEFCELNVTPGFEGLEQATGVNVAGSIIRMVASDLS